MAKKTSEEVIARIVAMRSSGMLLKEIAKALSINVTTVQGYTSKRIQMQRAGEVKKEIEENNEKIRKEEKKKEILYCTKLYAKSEEPKRFIDEVCMRAGYLIS